MHFQHAWTLNHVNPKSHEVRGRKIRKDKET